MSAASAEENYQRFVATHLKRNYVGHYLHGMLGLTGFRLLIAPTFLPAYLYLTSGSRAVVGLALALLSLGSSLSSVVGATYLEHRPRVLPFAMLTGTLMRLQILGIALAGFFLSGPALTFALLMFLFLFGLFNGPQIVAFQLLLAKVMPVHLRGRLQAFRNVAGGLVAALLSYVAGHWLIGEHVFGNGYGTTFLLAFVLTSLGLIALRVFIREPIPPTLPSRRSLRARTSEFPELLRRDRSFGYFLLMQVFTVSGRIATPFYVLYVGTSNELTGDKLGLISFAYLGADTVSNLAWGYIGDRFGHRANLVTALLLWLGGTLLLTSAHDFELMLAAFFALGAAQSAHTLSAGTLVLEFGEREDIAMRVAMSTTVETAVAALVPLLGGILASTAGYLRVFDISIACRLAALLLIVLLVKDPRRRSTAYART